jgi:hypothetical protein
MLHQPQASTMVLSATTEPTERSMPPDRMTKVMPDRHDDQKGVVDQQVQKHLGRKEPGVRHPAEHEHGQRTATP